MSTQFYSMFSFLFACFMFLHVCKFCMFLCFLLSFPYPVHTSTQLLNPANYAHVNKHQSEKPSININTTNVRVEDVRNDYHGNEGYSTLGSTQSDSRRLQHSSDNSQQSGFGFNGQLVTFPEGTIMANRGLKPEPLTITFEESTTTHSVEKMVPQSDGSNVRTISSYQTFAKSYSTSDASKDRNLGMILNEGVDKGPLAINLPHKHGSSTQR